MAKNRIDKQTGVLVVTIICCLLEYISKHSNLVEPVQLQSSCVYVEYHLQVLYFFTVKKQKYLQK